MREDRSGQGIPGRASSLPEEGADDLFERVNRRLRKHVMDVDPTQACLFLPHCLRSRECRAPQSKEGIACAGCGRCVVSMFVEVGTEMGLRVFCVPGGSVVETLIQRYRPRAVLGVACKKEIELALKSLGKGGLPLQVFALTRDGCCETGFDAKGLLAFLYEWRKERNRLMQGGVP